jgi:hypothetical protein
MKIKMIALLFLLLCLSLVVPSLATPGAQTDSKTPYKQTFSALAELPTGGTTTNVTIYITRYSTASDAEGLHAILLDGGAKALLKALHKMKSIGKIERTGTVGFYDLKLILSTTTSAGRHIYALTDRPIGFLESFYSTRSKDYPFGVMELDLQADEKGREKGVGTLVYAAKVKGLNGDKVEIENETFAPIRLLGVRQL